MHYEGLDSGTNKFWYSHHKLQVPWPSLSKVTTTGYQQFTVLFCKWVHPFCVYPTFSECLLTIVTWAGLFSLDRENVKNVQKSKRTVFFTQNPWKIVSEIFRWILITGRYWEKKKKLKRALRGKRTKKAFLVILISHFFSLEMKAMKQWGVELLTLFTLSSGS